MADLKQKSNDELSDMYLKLEAEQALARDDLYILQCLMTDEDIKKSDFMKGFTQLNKELDSIREELIARGIIHNKLIFPEL